MESASAIFIGCENDSRSETFVVVSIVMLLSFLSNSSTLPLWWWRKNQRELRLRLCFTNIVCGLSYFLMYYGVGVVLVYDGNTIRQRYILRNIDWLLSVSNIIWVLRVIAYQSMFRYLEWEHNHKSKSNVQIPERWLHMFSASGSILKYYHPILTNPKDSLEVQLRNYTSIQASCWTVDWACAITLGTIAEVVTSPFVKAVVGVVAVSIFIPMFIGLLVLIGNGLVPCNEYPFVDKEKSHNSQHEIFSTLFVDIFNTMYQIFYATECKPMDREEEAKSVIILKNSLLFILFAWTLYPIAWISAEAQIISQSTEVILFGFLDVLTKCLFAYFICNVGCNHFERVEQLKVEKDQRISKMRAEFFLQMNHELRTPLNAVIALSQLMLSGENLSANQETCSQSILSSAESLLNTINDVLDFSRMDSKGITFAVKPFNIIKSLEDTVDIVAVRAQENNVEISTDFSELSNVQVNGDAFRLHQIVLNIANNAVKFTKEGGSVTIRVEQICLNENLRVAICVIDTGVGIPESQIPTLFEPFSPATETTIRMFGGSGLGLSICKKLVEMMNGKIEVQSAVGVGTTIRAELSFPVVPETLVKERTDAKVLVLNEKVQQAMEKYKKIWNFELEETTVEKLPQMQGFDFLMVLPSEIHELKEKMSEGEIFAKFPQVVVLPKLKDNNPNYFDAKYNSQTKYLTIPIKRTTLYTLLVNKTVSAPKLVYGKFSNCKLLLVEDNKVNQKVMSMVFKKLGIKYELASDGLQGYEAVLTGDYDIILMDIQMPVLDGISSTKKIRESENLGLITKKNIIVALTAGSTPENEEECLKAGMDSFMTKPIDIGKLEEVIQKYQNK